MDRIKYEILEDGTITTETDAVSGKNHASADELLKQLATLTAGPVDVKHKRSVHTHTHLDISHHTADGHTHH